MKVLLALLTSVMFLTACEMQQDPLANASDQVRDGQLPETGKPTPEKPISKEGLQVDAPDMVNARVGSVVQFKIAGRVMIPGMNFKVVINNLSDFPGAKFDESSGEFSWIPMKTILGGQPSIGMSLRVSLITLVTPEHPTVSVENKDVRLIIENSYTKPVVNTIEGDGKLLAGESYNMTFTMEDIDAFSKDDVAVQVRDCPGSLYVDSIAHLVDVKNIKADVAVAGKYTGDLLVNLKNADAFNFGTYCFGLVAVSKFGVSSNFNKKEVTIEPRLRPTVMTLAVAQNIKAGETMHLSFSIFDPSGYATLRLVSMDDVAAVLPGSAISCKPAYGVLSQLDCAGVIKTDELTSAKAHNLKIIVESHASRSNRVATSEHTLRINVKAANP